MADTISPSVWEALGIAIAIVVAWTGVILWCVRTVIASQLEEVSSQLAGVRNSIDEEKAQWRRVEATLTTLQIELPQKYVQREDWIRFSSVIDAKQDRLQSDVALLHAKADTLSLQFKQWEKDRVHTNAPG